MKVYCLFTRPGRWFSLIAALHAGEPPAGLRADLSELSNYARVDNRQSRVLSRKTGLLRRSGENHSTLRDSC